MSILMSRCLHSKWKTLQKLSTHADCPPSETGEAYNYFVTTMNDYIRSTFGRSMRIVSCHCNPVIYSETDLRSSTVGNIPASVKLHQ